ncbi:MAG: glutamine--fructose-6-phosphate transaminase (isomerizing) [Eubacteriales bacterium]
MCGIVGYVGDKDVIHVLIEGLRKLEYRGYDSAGIAYLDQGKMVVQKEKGKLVQLEKVIGKKSIEKTIGIGHTRWATHGEPNYINSHPHTNMAGDIAIVHNGIIENYTSIKKWLQQKGVVFTSETDTEVIAHLVNYFLEGDLKLAVQKTIGMLEGSYALAVISERFPDEIVAAKKDSPLVVGLGEGENLIASDIPALLEHTRKVCFLNENEIVVIRKNSFELYDKYLNRLEREPFIVDWDISRAEKAGFEHFMIKEIDEEPRALTDTLLPRLVDGVINLEEAGLTDEVLAKVKKMVIVACGTAYHASMLGKYIIEKMVRIPVDVDIASEFRYRNPMIDKDTFMIVLSQSGETADTIAALREGKARGAFVLAVANVVGSTVAREADAVLYTRAGPEIAVASTKAYTTQLMSLYMICIKIAAVQNKITLEEYSRYIEELKKVPDHVKEIIKEKEVLQRFASEHFREHSVFYIGRGIDYALSMEGSLKLKEISYIHSEAYAAGELKHGTIALIEKGTLVIAVLTQEDLIEKSLSNVKEVTARGAIVLGITQERFAAKIAEYVDQVVTIPDTIDFMSSMSGIIPMQVFAYYMAVLKGCDVDKPRNLAKSVTVE